jgi:hypothetical protein
VMAREEDDGHTLTRNGDDATGRGGASGGEQENLGFRRCVAGGVHQIQQ